MTISNDPMMESVFLLKQYRPFSLTLTLEKQDGSRVDLTDCSLRLVIVDLKRKGGGIRATSAATIVSAVDGTARFDVQAEDLSFTPGLYDMAISLTSAEGFVSSIVEGQVELAYNADPVIPIAHGGVVPPLSLTATLRDSNQVTVRVNHHPDSVLLDAEAAALAAASSAAISSNEANAHRDAALTHSANASTARVAAQAAQAAAEAAAEEALQNGAMAQENVTVLASTFGVKSDGVSDDTAALLAAVASLPAAGGVVLLPPGVCLVTDAGGGTAITLSASNVTLRGCGVGTTILRGSGAPSHIINMTGSGCVVEHLTVDGGANGDFSMGVHGIRVQGLNQKIRHVAITNCRAYGIGVGQSDGSTVQGLRIDDVDISNTGNDSIDTKNRDDSNADIIYSRITARTWGQNPATTVQAGIDCRGPVKITDVTVFPSGDQVGIRFREGEGGAVNGIGAHRASLSQFHVEASGSTAVVGVYVAARYVSISSGHIFGAHHGVDLIDGYAAISGVHVQGCVTNGFRFRAAGSTSDFSTATGCTANDGDTGFRVEVPGIRLEHCTAHGNSSYGIDLTASAVDTVLRDCDLNENALANVRDAGVSTHAFNNMGWKTKGRFTAEVAIDSTGTKTATVAHGLAVTPNLNDVQLSLARVTAVTDPGFSYLWCENVTGVNAVVRLRVSAASATPGAVVRIVGEVDARP